MFGRFAPALYVLGVLVTGFGFLMLIPLAISWLTADGAQGAYDEAVLITVLSGALLSFSIGRQPREMRVRESFLLVALIWVLLPAFGALPLYLHIDGLTWTDAYFEAVSGLTATGATALSGLDQLPLSINFWRTFMHWVGGLGVVVLAVAILPLLGFGGRGMLKAETPGPMKDSKITPRITETAKGLWVVYVILTAACAGSLYFLGMDGWDALMHAFSVMGLGGFSSKDASLGHFDSLDIELVVIFFALLAGINFSTHFLAFSQRSLRAYLADIEAHYFLGILALSILALSVYLWPQAIYADFLTTLRYVAFHSVSLATSLGFATTDYVQWPLFGQLWILFLGSFVACSGSAGGGIKMMRAVVLYKQVSRELTRAMHPRGPADGALRRDGHSGPGAARHPWLHVHLRGQHRRDDATDGRHATGHHHRLLGRRRLLEQHRSRTESRRPGLDLRRADRLADLGVHLGHASRTPRDFHSAGPADAGFLAELGQSPSALHATAMAAASARPRDPTIACAQA
jgi:trk system potassium uptake protein TrkH